MATATEDSSNGYEAVATIYIAGRGTRSRVGDSIGAAVVKAWADAFPPGATVLDLGAGPGEPISGTDPDELAAIEADVRRDYAGPVYLGTDLLSIEV